MDNKCLEYDTKTKNMLLWIRMQIMNLGINLSERRQHILVKLYCLVFILFVI